LCLWPVQYLEWLCLALLSLTVEVLSPSLSQAGLHVASNSKASSIRLQRSPRSRDSSATRPHGSTSPARSSRTLESSIVVVASLQAAQALIAPYHLLCMSGSGGGLYQSRRLLFHLASPHLPISQIVQLGVVIIKGDSAGLLLCCWCCLRLCCCLLSEVVTRHVCWRLKIAPPPCAQRPHRCCCFSWWCEPVSQGA
jgi:hypothetical protein